MVGKLQGTPWHIETLSLDEGEKRRHQSRCIYFKQPNNCKFNSRCIGSSHCSIYKEKDKSSERTDIFDEVFIENKKENIGIATKENILNKYRSKSSIKKDVKIKKEGLVKDYLKNKDKNAIKIGSIVKIKYLENNLVEEYKIVSKKIDENFIDTIHFSRPIAQGVLGKNKGDTISIFTDGEIKVEILNVR